jgi:Methyltransferase domain
LDERLFSNLQAETTDLLTLVTPMKENIQKALNEKNAIQRQLAKRFLFGLFQRLGFHITGDHFYEIIPNTRFVAANYSGQPRSLNGIDFHFLECENRALQLIKAYGAEYAPSLLKKYGYREDNHYFRELDALTLYLMIRDLKPRKIVEIGQGFSTSIIFSALEMNTQETGQSVEFLSLDPYSRFAPAQIPKDVNYRCIRQELQRADIAALMKGCSFLFVDSSHVYKFGSDVEYEFTRIYPNLDPQTVVHLHDVFSPYDYPLDWALVQKRFWNEQYFLENFLMFNNAFDVYLPLHLLARQSSQMAEAVKRLSLDEGFRYNAQSFYLKRR